MINKIFQNLWKTEDDNMRIGISGTEWVVSRYSGDHIREITCHAERLGISFLELWVPHNFKKEETEEVKRKLDELDMKAICISTPSGLNRPTDYNGVKRNQDLILHSIEVATRLGAETVNTYFGPNPARSEAEAIKTYVENIKPCLKAAEDNSIVITIENEFDPTGSDVTRRADGCLKLLRAVNSDCFLLNFDACNFYVAGEEPYPYAYLLLKDYVKYIHLKDAAKYDSQLYGERGELFRDKGGISIPVSLGEGGVNYEAYLEALKKDGYTGYLVLEPHFPLSQLKDEYEKALNYLKAKGIWK